MARPHIRRANVRVGAQEAFHFLYNAGLICWTLTYVVMFAISLVGRSEKPPIAVQTGAASGVAMTLAYAVLSTFPVVDVKNSAYFTARVMMLILVINAGGALYFSYARRRGMGVVGEPEIV